LESLHLGLQMREAAMFCRIFVYLLVTLILSWGSFSKILPILFLPDGIAMQAQDDRQYEFTSKTPWVTPYSRYDYEKAYWEAAFTQDCAICLVTVLTARDVQLVGSDVAQSMYMVVQVDRVFYNGTGNTVLPGKLLTVAFEDSSRLTPCFGLREPKAARQYYMILRTLRAENEYPDLHYLHAADYCVGPSAYCYMPLSFGRVMCYSTMLEAGFDVRVRVDPTYVNKKDFHFHSVSQPVFEQFLTQYIRFRYQEPMTYEDPYIQAKDGEVIDYGRFFGWFYDKPTPVEETIEVTYSIEVSEAPEKEGTAQVVFRVLGRRELVGYYTYSHSRKDVYVSQGLITWYSYFIYQIEILEIQENHRKNTTNLKPGDIVTMKSFPSKIDFPGSSRQLVEGDVVLGVLEDESFRKGEVEPKQQEFIDTSVRIAPYAMYYFSILEDGGDVPEPVHQKPLHTLWDTVQENWQITLKLKDWVMETFFQDYMKKRQPENTLYPIITEIPYSPHE